MNRRLDQLVIATLPQTRMRSNSVVLGVFIVMKGGEFNPRGGFLPGLGVSNLCGAFSSLLVWVLLKLEVVNLPSLS